MNRRLPRLLLLALGVPLLAALPSPVRAHPAAAHHVTPVHGKTCRHTKISRGKKHGTYTCQTHPHKRSPSHRRVKPKATPRTVHKRVATATPTRHRVHKHAATSTPTRTPTATATATATATSTATPAATATFTPTLTPTPAPSIATFPVQANVQAGLRVIFYVCGLPSGVGVAFDPAKATATSDSGSPTGASARATLLATVQPGTLPSVYPLAIHAYVQDGNKNVLASPGAGDLKPGGVLLTVDSSGAASLAPTDAQIVDDRTNCSPLPPGVAPTPTPLPVPGDVSVSATTSRASDGSVLVTGKITERGQPVDAVPLHARWYFPDGIRECAALTDGTGTASCSEYSSALRPGFVVQIQVYFTYLGQDFSALTSYTL